MSESHFEKRRAASASNFRLTFWKMYWKVLISNSIFHQIINLNLCWTLYKVFVQVKKQQVVSDMPGGGKQWWSMGDEWRSQQSADEWGTVLVANGHRGESSQWWGGQWVKWSTETCCWIQYMCVVWRLRWYSPCLTFHITITELWYCYLFLQITYPSSFILLDCVENVILLTCYAAEYTGSAKYWSEGESNIIDSVQQ